MYKKNILKFLNQYRNLFIISSFFILSIFSTLLLVHSHFLSGGFDTYVHWQRIMEIKKSFANNHFFPNFALNEFNSNGSAIMTFYPYLNLLPIVALSYIIKSGINLIYFSFSLYTFITLLISYYGSLHINKRIDTSYLFSIMYSLSTLMIYHGFQQMDLGLLNTMMFLPLVIFGFIDFIKNNNWLEMSFGLTLMILTHVLNSVFTIIFMFIWLLININRLNKNKIISLVKGIILTLITTSIFYFPLLKLSFLNKIHTPLTFQLSGVSFYDLIINAFDNNINYTIGIFAILGAFIIPLFFYNKFDFIIKQIYWLSISILIIISNIFPWSLFQNSVIKIIQFSWRLYFIPQLLLIYIFALGMTKYLSRRMVKTYTLSGLIVFTLLLQIGAQNQIINKFQNYPSLNKKADNEINLVGGAYKLDNAHQMNNLSYGFSSPDYYPEQSTTWFNILRYHGGIYNKTRFVKFIPLGNGHFKFSNNYRNHNELSVPFVGYNGIKYKAYLDGHLIPFKLNKSKLLTLKNVSVGKHYIQIKVISTLSNVITRTLFFVGMFIYLLLSCKNIYFKYKY